jgi:hypothetical protein
MLWIQYVKGPVRHIIFWYFTRKIGGRVVGVVLTYLVFLGYHRHQNNTNPSNIRNHQLLHALDMPSDSDFDSDEEFTEEWTSGVVTKQLTLLFPLHMVLLP